MCIYFGVNEFNNSMKFMITVAARCHAPEKSMLNLQFK